jgi:hypothetical protein
MRDFYLTPITQQLNSEALVAALTGDFAIKVEAGRGLPSQTAKRSWPGRLASLKAKVRSASRRTATRRDRR